MARTPTPNTPVRGSRSGRPIMALLDLLGRRWTLRVIWELRDGALTFRALQQACGGLSPSVLNQRLTELRESRLLDQGHDGYVLTALGLELFEQFQPLNDWAEHWSRQLRRGE